MTEKELNKLLNEIIKCGNDINKMCISKDYRLSIVYSAISIMKAEMIKKSPELKLLDQQLPNYFKVTSKIERVQK